MTASRFTHTDDDDDDDDEFGFGLAGIATPPQDDTPPPAVAAHRSPSRPVARRTASARPSSPPAGDTTIDGRQVRDWPTIGPYVTCGDPAGGTVDVFDMVDVGGGRLVEPTRPIKVNMMISPTAVTLLTLSLTFWSQQHSEWVLGNGGIPGRSVWRTALLRTGLEHVNDPDLVRLLPAKTPSPVQSMVPAGDPVTIPRWLKQLPARIYDHDTGKRQRDTCYVEPRVLADINRARTEWVVAHPEMLLVFQGAPGQYVWFEGLMRLGLKHAETTLVRYLRGDARGR